MTAPAKGVCELITKRVHMKLAVEALRPSIERNKIRTYRTHLFLGRAARQLADARPPRQTDGLAIGRNPAQEAKPRLSHALFDQLEVNAVCDDARLTQPKAPLQGALKFLVAVHRDGDAYDPRRERTP